MTVWWAGARDTDLGHGVGDSEEDSRVGARHLSVGEVEASGDGELVE